MTTPINAYEQWLGIASSQGMPNNYELLGIFTTETNPQVIEQAASHRLEQIKPHLSGPSTALAKRLKYEIESARDCILDPVQRVAYDSSLSKRATNTSTVSAINPPHANVKSPQHVGAPTAKAMALPVARRIPTPVPGNKPSNANGSGFDINLLEGLVDAASSASTESPLLVFPQPTSSTKRKKKSKPSLSTQIVALAVLLVPALVIGSIVYLYFFRSELDDTKVAEVKPSQSSSTNRAASGSRSGDADKQPTFSPPASQETSDDNKVQEDETNDPDDALVEDDPNSVPEQNPSGAAEVTESVDPSPFQPLAENGAPANRERGPPPQNTVEIPKFVDLPPMAGQGVSDFTGLFSCAATDDDQIDLSIENPAADVLGIKATYTAERINAEEAGPAWRINLVSSASEVIEAADRRIPIADFAVKDQELCFRWLGGPSYLQGHMLRNCLLSVILYQTNYRVALRTPTVVAAEPIDLSKEQKLIPLEGDWLPKMSVMQLELLEANNVAIASSIPQKVIQGTSEELRVIYKQDVPQVDVRLRLTGATGVAAVRCRCVIVDRDGDLYPITKSRLETMHRTLPRNLEEAKESYQKNSAKLDNLAAELRLVQSLPDRDLSSNKAYRATALQKEISKAGTALNRSDKNIRDLTLRLQVLPGIRQAADAIDGNVVLKYRVYFVVGNTKVDVLRVE